VGVLTLANICDQVLKELGFVSFGSYIGSTTPAALQVGALANVAAPQLRQYGMQALTKSTTRALTTGTDTYELPTGFWHLVADTSFKSSSSNGVKIATDPAEWAYLKASGASGGGTNYRARIINNLLNVHQATTGDTLRFEYVDSRPIQATGAGALKERFTADTDVWLLDDELIVRDLSWRLQKAKGMPSWNAAFQDFRNYARHKRGTETGMRTLSMPGEEGPYDPPAPYTDLQVG
jgi:hypothetical protein